MSEDDQQPECTRQWRSLSRALIVAGATVAGTSAVWLAAVTASADIAAESLQLGDSARTVIDNPVPTAPGTHAGGTDGRLLENDPPDDPAATADPVSPDGAMGAENPSHPDPAAFRLSDLDQDGLTAVRSGPGGPGASPRQVVTTAPDPSGASPGVVDPPHVDDTPNVRPGPAVRAAQSGAAVTTAAEDRAPHQPREHAHGRGTHTEPRGTAAERPPGPPGSMRAEAALCEWDADWPGSTAVLQARQHGAERGEAAARTGATRNSNALTGIPENQPGTTPD